MAERCRLQQAAGYAPGNVDVRKAAVTNHDTAHSIVLALKKFDVRRHVLGHKVVVRQSHHRHLLVRINLAGADSRKVFGTTDYPGFLETAQVDGGIAENFAGRTSKRAGV